MTARRALGTGPQVPPASMPPRPTSSTSCPASASRTSTNCAAVASSDPAAQRDVARRPLGAGGRAAGEE
ncbi:hypothetical protein [Streptomyces sp. NPDC101115]|uniref:hypothetical protein n=1 Tax=Streptomyces sp. NPDC101115 TaxID=3366106 RepID=UPI00381E156C